MTSAFATWATTAASIDTTSVKIVETEGEGYGLVAAADIAEENPIFTIPLSQVLRVDLANVGDANAKLLAMLESTHALAVAAWLASVTEPTASHIAPWLAMWPEAPVGGWGFTKEEWAGLREWCPEADALHKAQEQSLRTAYDEKIAPHFASNGGGDGVAPPPWERLVYFHSMVLSRAADLKRVDLRLAIIPLLDLLNHRVTPSAYLSFDAQACDGKGGFVVKAYAALAAGDPLFICYGDKENAELLVSYGFALRKNPSDTASMKVAVAADHPLGAANPEANAQLFHGIIPHGVKPVFEKAASGQGVLGAVRWVWDDSMYEERPINVDEQLVLQADVSEDALLVAALAKVSAPEQVMSVFFGMGAGRSASASVCETIAAACAETLASLPEPPPGDASAPIAVALAARRELLSAVVAQGGRPLEREQDAEGEVLE